MKQLRGLYAQTFFTFRTTLVQYETSLVYLVMSDWWAPGNQKFKAYSSLRFEDR